MGCCSVLFVPDQLLVGFDNVSQFVGQVILEEGKGRGREKENEIHYSDAAHS